MTAPTRIAVALWTSGRAADEGAGAWFAEHTRFVSLPFRERSAADVLLFLAPGAVERALAALATPVDRRTRPSVLVTDRLGPRQVAEAVDRGAVRLLDHGTAAMAEVADALIAAVVDAEVPEPVAGRGPWGVEEPQPGGALDARTGLSPREVEVLRRLAAGRRVAEISAELNYSERTIKGIVHDVVSRFGFRNRVQAVAYGIRVGAY